MNKENNTIITLINFIKNNNTKIFTTLFFILAIIVLTIFVYTRIQSANSLASYKVSLATQYIVMGSAEDGIKLLDDVIENNSKSSSAYTAMLTKANYLYSQKDYEQTKQIAQTIITKAKPETLQPLAYPILIASNEELNNIDEAINLSQQFLNKYSNHFLVPSIMENLARLYLANNNKEDANKIYNSIIELFPETSYANRAHKQLKSK